VAERREERARERRQQQISIVAVHAVCMLMSQDDGTLFVVEQCKHRR